MSALYALEFGDRCESCRSKGGCFSAISEAAVQAFETVKLTCSYPPGALLFVQGHDSGGAFLLCKGRVKLMMTGSAAKSIIVRIAEPGQLIGLECAISGKPSSMTAETFDPCVVHFVKRDAVRTLMRHHHDVCVAIAEQLSNDYRSACFHIRSLGLSRTASERVVHFLLEWAAKGRETDEGIRVIVPLKHEEIAQMVGVSRETVTRTLTELKHRALITMKGPTMLIRDESALKALLVN
jgi:CRP/FNR family cyclic AMP-dependent transcriptional regulator